MDLSPLDIQIHRYIVDGMTLEECLPLLRKKFTFETGDHIKERWAFFHSNSSVNPRRTAAEELQWIRCRRQYILQKMEEKIAAEEEKVPVSLLSLYRGVLREQEKFCLEMLKRGEPLLNTPVPFVEQKPFAHGKANALATACLAFFLVFAGYMLRSSMGSSRDLQYSRSTECSVTTSLTEATPSLSHERSRGVPLCNSLWPCDSSKLSMGGTIGIASSRSILTQDQTPITQGSACSPGTVNSMTSPAGTSCWSCSTA